MAAIRDRPGLVRKKVTVHRGGKTFQQYRWVKSGEDEAPEKQKRAETEGEKQAAQKDTRIDMNVMIEGKLPTLQSMPADIKIPREEISKMEKIRKKSKEIEKEIGVPIHFKDNKMSLGEINNNIGDGMSVSVPTGVDTYAIYHTHPPNGKVLPLDTLSIVDIMLVTTRHRYQRTNIMMAHTVHNGNLWVCVPSAETMDAIDEGMSDIVGTQKFVTRINSDCETAIMEKDPKSYRRAIKKYCDKFKMKLYVGPPDNLREYNGEW